MCLAIAHRIVGPRLTAAPPPQKELAAKLDKEVPKNHLDMRHRLDNEGKRYGKVINYK